MHAIDLLKDSFARVLGDATEILHGITDGELVDRPGIEANSIAWLIWHTARVQDSQVAPLKDIEQVWTAQNFVERFNLPLEPTDTGYGHSSDQVAAVKAPARLLLEYLTATHEQTLHALDRLSEGELDKVVDTRWSPPVTLGVRLISVLNDDVQHVGQAAYVLGLLRTR